MSRSTVVAPETLTMILRAGLTDEDELTSEQVAVITAELKHAVSLLADSESRRLRERAEDLRRMADDRADDRERQRERDQKAAERVGALEKEIEKLDERLTSQERWRIRLLGAFALVMGALGLAPAWIGFLR